MYKKRKQMLLLYTRCLHGIFYLYFLFTLYVFSHLFSSPNANKINKIKKNLFYSKFQIN
jgi:hypothetical protein